MSNKPTCEAEANEIFKVSGFAMENHWDKSLKRFRQTWTTPKAILITKESLDAYNKWECMGFKPERTLPLGKMWPCGVKVETISRKSRWKCHVEETYRITSPSNLEVGDWNVLRAQGCFMAGQSTGIPDKGRKLDDGTWEYIAFSECDSSD